MPLALRERQRGAGWRRSQHGEPLLFGARTKMPNVHFRLKRAPCLPTSHGWCSLLYWGGRGSEAMGLSAKMKPWPHPAFPDSSLLPVLGRRALQVKAGLSLCEQDTGKAGLAHRVTPRGPVFSPGPRWTTFSFFPLPSPGLRQTLEQTLSTVVHSLRSQKRLAVPTESSKDFLSH